ncbi:MAG: tryptophan--tRNA ligase [Candidatus Portnoybacteria bacterium CG23_combo_of_CG06-09_8_20_14_all_37_13]|uniref:Tryptophan--tRNA ligase n=1 Tax=Candidatus Portnoybacteria bacterium CG23_combo_of_CG06-09_8_20_14_all_37_13 TaxID=1974819 RepID=A0A2G9YDD0_9BACT|nr:MAG: tryptophan--tRNA ligase [Candidatus Portnoybacteria bacterium CG23_combo_of_CG06-09_8_20_14_all_37_13]
MLQEKQVVLSGIRATGKMHLGNYLGAMKNFVDLQNTEGYQCFYFVADYHTLTTNPDPDELKTNLPGIVLDYLAAGIDPEKSTLYAQSSVPELAELCLLIGMVTPIGELMRCPTFKEKARKQPDNVNHGLFTYPVLMAADILGPKADLVPVGEDQLPHVEITRFIANRFNSRYGKVFELPVALMEKAIRVPGLDGTDKMGKSEGNTIDLSDSADAVWEKLRVAVTDEQRERRSDPGRPYLCNLYALHEFVSPTDIVKAIDEECRSATIGCIDCKKKLAENITAILDPLQQRRVEIAKGPDYIRQVLHDGGQRAREIIKETVAEVRQKMGLIMY